MTETTQGAKLSFYDRLKLATRHRLAEPILAALCFLEAMILPIFPEIMLAPMIIADRMRAWRLATICTVASVTGGLAGYAIGQPVQPGSFDGFRGLLSEGFIEERI